jgi:hypothetical protein
MTNLQLFDHYSFRARLQPALLTLLPAAFGVFAWTGPGAKWTSALWTLFGTVGGTFFLAVLARNLGKRVEPALWESWGGSPTVQLLRHGGGGNPVLRERWHKFLSKLLGRPVPTPQEEQADPKSADDVYEAGVKLLINKSRDARKFPLVYRENVQYGYCRNLFAMRSMGFPVSLLGSLACLASALWGAHSGDAKIYPWVCLAGDLVFVTWWVFVIKPSWVRVPAFAYAERLLESIENIPLPRTASAEKSAR